MTELGERAVEVAKCKRTWDIKRIGDEEIEAFA